MESAFYVGNNKSAVRVGGWIEKCWNKELAKIRRHYFFNKLLNHVFQIVKIIIEGVVVNLGYSGYFGDSNFFERFFFKFAPKGLLKSLVCVSLSFGFLWSCHVIPIVRCYESNGQSVAVDLGAALDLKRCAVDLLSAILL